jgi:hypothetical protein
MGHKRTFPDAYANSLLGLKISLFRGVGNLSQSPEIIAFTEPPQPHAGAELKNSLFFSLLAGNFGVETG